jgi:hypothetical protein
MSGAPVRAAQVAAMIPGTDATRHPTEDIAIGGRASWPP